MRHDARMTENGPVISIELRDRERYACQRCGIYYAAAGHCIFDHVCKPSTMPIPHNPSDSIDWQRKRKRKLEQSIAALCDAYTSETGLGIHEISLSFRHVECEDGDREFDGHGVTVTVQRIEI